MISLQEQQSQRHGQQPGNDGASILFSVAEERHETHQIHFYFIQAY
jgi:hypothetical protein